MCVDNKVKTALPKFSLPVLNMIRPQTRSQQLQQSLQMKKSPFLPRHQHISPVKINIPDSGASIFLAGPQQIAKFNLDTHDLISCYKQVKAVGGSKLICHGQLPITFQIGKNTTKQPVYICDIGGRFYFRRKDVLTSTYFPKCSLFQ